jgi:uncharacterized integral membrane protein
MRLIKSLIALCFIVLGVIFGALNKQRVDVDLWFKVIEGRLGLVLLTVLLFGALLGGLVVTAGVVWPLRRRMHPSAGSTSGPDARELTSEKDAWP